MPDVTLLQLLHAKTCTVQNNIFWRKYLEKILALVIKHNTKTAVILLHSGKKKQQKYSNCFCTLKNLTLDVHIHNAAVLLFGSPQKKCAAPAPFCVTIPYFSVDWDSQSLYTAAILEHGGPNRGTESKNKQQKWAACREIHDNWACAFVSNLPNNYFDRSVSKNSMKHDRHAAPHRTKHCTALHASPTHWNVIPLMFILCTLLFNCLFISPRIWAPSRGRVKIRLLWNGISLISVEGVDGSRKYFKLFFFWHFVMILVSKCM